LVDGAGRLWVIDGGTGRIVQVDADGRRDVPGTVDPAGASLVLTGEQVAVVDIGRPAARLPGDDGISKPVACIDTQAGDDTVRVAGSMSGGRVLAASGRRGVLLVADLSDTSCDNTLIN